jgi:acetyl esterase/lipase
MALPLLIVVFALAGGCATMNTNLNVVYAQTPGVDPHLQSLDIYSPNDGKRHPVVLMIHGGDWTGGDKADPDVINNKMPWFVKQGYVFISMNYRLRPAATVLDQAMDVAKARQFIYQNAPLYGGDSTRVLLIGHGSGAYLAAWVATDAQVWEDAETGLKPTDLAGVVLLDPQALDLPYEMPLLAQSDVPTYRTYQSVFGEDVVPDFPAAHVWPGLSPLHYLQDGQIELPYLIALSSDMQGPDYTAAQHFTAALEGAKIPVKFKYFEYLTHATINSELGSPEEMLTKKETLTTDVTDFLANPAGYAAGATLPQPE